MKPLFYVLSIFAITTACKSTIETVKPTESYISQEIKTEPSTINAKVTLDIAKLEKSINKSFAGNVYEDNSYADDNMQIKISKIKDFAISINGNKISYTLPLKVWVKYELKKDVLGVIIKDYYEAEGSINVSLQTIFSISKDWNLKTETSIITYKWITSPTVTVAGITIPVTTVANIALVAVKKDISGLIDESIAEIFNLQSTMQSVWKSMQLPIEIDKDYTMWMRMTPNSIYSSPISGTGKLLSFSLGIKTLVDVSMGEVLSPLPKPTKLPEYLVKNDVASDFSIHSNMLITFAKISEIAKQYVVGQEYKTGKKKIVIDSIGIFGHDNSLIVAVGVKGSVNGIIYCTGNIQFIDSIQAIQITNFNYDLNTKNTLVKSANWLLHKNFLKMIEPMLTIPIKSDIEAILAESNQYLKNYQLYKGVFAQGKLQNLTVKSIYISSKGIQVNGLIKGNISILINDIL